MNRRNKLYTKGSSSRKHKKFPTFARNLVNFGPQTAKIYWSLFTHPLLALSRR